jgi:hypothetical protein
MEQKKTISAEEKWKSGGMDHSIRFEMLAVLGQPQCYAKDSWKKLPHILKVNLQNRTWAAPSEKS